MKDLSIQELHEKITDLEDTVHKLLVENKFLRRQLYGSKSEKIKEDEKSEENPSDLSQNDSPTEDPSNESPPIDPPENKCPTEEPPGEKHPKTPMVAEKIQKKNRAKLKTEDIIHDVLSCSHCDSLRLTSTGTKIISEEIEYIPAYLVLRKHHCIRKRCLDCEKMVVAQGPARVTENCDYGPCLHAYVASSKCAESMPLYRLSRQIQRQGINLAPSTLGDIFHRTATILKPIYNRLGEIVKAAFYVGADETPLNLWAHDRCKRGYIWTFHCPEVITYVFEDTRSGDVPKQFLANTSGILTADAYSGYNAVCTPEGRKRSGCMAHLRRKFFNYLGTAKDDAMEGILMIRQLYMVEIDAATKNLLGADAHLEMRKSISSVIMKQLQEECTKWKEVHSPKSPMGKAVIYATNQ